MRKVSEEREASGAPSFMDIITKPGWDKRIGDVYDVDEDWNIVPPTGPELLPPAFKPTQSSHCLPPPHASSQQHSHRTDSVEDSARSGQEDEEDQEKDDDGVGVEALRHQELEQLRTRLEQADYDQDCMGTLVVLQEMARMQGTREIVDGLLSEVQHASAKAALGMQKPGCCSGRHGTHTNSTCLTCVRIGKVAHALQDSWAQLVKSEIEKQAAVDSIVMPAAKPHKTAKSYASIKQRLREAGLPTGGKKRKILQRIKCGLLSWLMAPIMMPMPLLLPHAAARSYLAFAL